MEREASPRGVFGSRGVAHSLGRWLSPAADLFPAEVAGRHADLVRCPLAGSIPGKGSRSERPRGPGILVLLPEPLRLHASDERPARAADHARELGPEGLEQR